jgi:hypothetical protein
VHARSARLEETSDALRQRRAELATAEGEPSCKRAARSSAQLEEGDELQARGAQLSSAGGRRRAASARRAAQLEEGRRPRKPCSSAAPSSTRPGSSSPERVRRRGGARKRGSQGAARGARCRARRQVPGAGRGAGRAPGPRGLASLESTSCARARPRSRPSCSKPGASSRRRSKGELDATKGELGEAKAQLAARSRALETSESALEVSTRELASARRELT